MFFQISLIDDNVLSDLYGAFLGIQRRLMKQQMQKSRNKDNNTKNTKMRYNSLMVIGHFEKVSLQGFPEDGE